MSKALALAGVTLLAVTAARATDLVDPPSVHVNDVWKYNRTDGFTDEVTSVMTVRVVEISDNEIISKQDGRSENANKTILLYTDRLWNVVDNAETKFTPSISYYRWPVHPGDSYTIDYAGSALKTGATAACRNIVNVTGEEKVTVPAGTFDSVRFDITSECRSPGTDATIYHHKVSSWYSSAVNRFVKLTDSTMADGRVRLRYEFDLVEYKPAP